MKVRLGTVEVNDSVRRALRRRVGRRGLATHDEVRDFFLMVADAALDDVVAENTTDTKNTNKETT